MLPFANLLVPETPFCRTSLQEVRIRHKTLGEKAEAVIVASSPYSLDFLWPPSLWQATLSTLCYRYMCPSLISIIKSCSFLVESLSNLFLNLHSTQQSVFYSRAFSKHLLNKYCKKRWEMAFLTDSL